MTATSWQGETSEARANGTVIQLGDGLIGATQVSDRISNVG